MTAEIIGAMFCGTACMGGRSSAFKGQAVVNSGSYARIAARTPGVKLADVPRITRRGRHFEVEGAARISSKLDTKARDQVQCFFTIRLLVAQSAAFCAHYCNPLRDRDLCLRDGGPKTIFLT
jgi:hypothetical protein